MRAERDLPDLQGRLLAAGEDPAEVIASISEFMADGMATEESELAGESALRARMVGVRLAGGGIGLDALLELVQTIQQEIESTLLESSPGARVSVAAMRRLNRVGAALALTLTRTYVETTLEDHLEQERALRGLITIARAVSRSLEPAEVADAGLTETVAAMRLDSGAVWLVADATHGLALETTAGLAGAEVAILERIDITAHEQILASIRSGVPAQLSLETDGSLIGGYRSALVVPLTGSHGLLGVMALGSRAERMFSPDEVIFVGSVADHMANALDHAVEHRLEAHTDYLTGLANRAEFENGVRRELASAHRSRRPLALLLMDLNRLKRINDGFGHHAGDEAIRAIGRILRQVVRTSDMSARLGGDEFGVAMPEASIAQAEEVVTRIRAALDALNLSRGRSFAIELSYGMAEWQPGQDFVQLFKAADLRLYADKRRNHVRAASKIQGSPTAETPESSPRPSSPETPSR